MQRMEIVLFAAAAMFFLLAGCASDEENIFSQGQNNSPVQPQPLPVSISNNSSALPPVDNSSSNASNFSSINAKINQSQFNSSHALPQAIYFYLPTCPYCARIEHVVSAMEAKFNGSVEIRRVNANTNEGFAQFDAAIRRLNLPDSSRVVPLFAFENHALVGEQEINQSLEGLLLNLSRG